MSFEQLQEERNFEQNTLVWLDENLNNTEEINQIKLKLRQIINYIRIFGNADECVDYMSSSENQQIYFLVSGSLADIIVPLIYEMEQIKMIYIFCINNRYYGKLAQIFHKTTGIFTDLTVLCDKLRRDILTDKTAALSIHKSSTLLLSALSSSASDRSEQQEAAFMYFRLLSELLVGLDHKQSTKNEFISICRSQYHGNTSELEKIEEFSRTYSKEHAIRWYTRNSFLYRILNNALRTQDIDILFKLGFFIADLYNQLKCLHSKQSKSLILPSVVYRGQFMSKNEFDIKIQKNIGGFLSINSFFSTSANKRVALMFAGNSSSNDPNIESVLFEITINIEKCHQPVADIKDISHIEEEDEVLFSMAAVFRIESVHRLYYEDIWTVRLVMNGEEDEELNAVANNIKEEIGKPNSLDTLGGLLMKMGDFQKAEDYLLMLIKDTQLDDSFTRARYYSNLSVIYNEQLNSDAALSWGEKALQLGPSDPSILAAIYTNIGLSNVKKGNTAQALNYLHKTVDIYKDILPSNHLTIGLTYLNPGLLYGNQNNFPRALEYFLKTTDIFQNSLSAYHPNLALAYCHIGAIYLNQRDYDSALCYLLKCLKIQQRSLPAKHPHLAYTYTNLGTVYLEQFHDVEAHNSFQETLQIIGSSPNHPALPFVMYNLGESHKRKNNLAEALNFFHKALDAQIKSTSSHDTLMIAIYKALGTLYFQQDDYIKAIDYCQRAIPIALTHNHDDLTFFYCTISASSTLIGDYETASQYVELALDVGCCTLPSDHPYIQAAKGHQILLKSLRERSYENFIS